MPCGHAIIRSVAFWRDSTTLNAAKHPQSFPMTGKQTFVERIVFPMPFSDEPAILVSITGFHASGDCVNIDARIGNHDANGFDLHVSCEANCTLHEATITYLAIGQQGHS